MVKKISEGAEAIIYSTRFLGFDAVVKERVRKRYRIKEMDDRIRAMRTKSEARMLVFARDAGVCVPSVMLVDRYSICMSRIRGRNLNALMKQESNLDGIFYKLGSYAGMLHDAGIAHGDYTPANVLIDDNHEPWIIDFGLSEATNSFEEEALDLLLMKRSASAGQFASFLKGYKIQCKKSAEVLRRLVGIERRGRYQTRTLLAEGTD
jgi:Kae1-associated kinase Bud32